jgi:hypothetical protein
VAYIVDMSPSEIMGQVHVSALMPTVANASYTSATANILKFKSGGTVGSCSGGPSCKPDVQSGSLATVISNPSSSTTSDGDGDNTVAIAAGVAVPVALARWRAW